MSSYFFDFSNYNSIYFIFSFMFLVSLVILYFFCKFYFFFTWWSSSFIYSKQLLSYLIFYSKIDFSLQSFVTMLRWEIYFFSIYLLISSITFSWFPFIIEIAPFNFTAYLSNSLFIFSNLTFSFSSTLILYWSSFSLYWFFYFYLDVIIAKFSDPSFYNINNFSVSSWFLPWY